MSPIDASPANRLRALATGYFLPRALYAVAVLDVAGCLAGASMTAQQIAEKMKLHGPSLYRILRALATAGIFNEDARGCFSNTPMSQLLRSDVPHSLRDLVLLFGHPTSWRAWEAIVHTVSTGEAGFEHVYQEKFFDHLASHAETASMFDRAMASASSTVNAAVIEAYDFSDCDVVIDVAGGIGATLCAILGANPNVRGIVFDLPHVEERARAYIAQTGVAARCQFVGGSFFDAVPNGAHLYFMKHILHDWGDDEGLRILRACRTAMNPGTRLLICERIVPLGNEPAPAKIIDLHMLITNHGGKERTEQEYRQLLEAAGFKLQRVIATKSPWSLLEAA